MPTCGRTGIPKCWRSSWRGSPIGVAARKDSRWRRRTGRYERSLASSSSTLEQVALEFLTVLEQERGFARNTIDAYRSDLGQFGAPQAESSVESPALALVRARPPTRSDSLDRLESTSSVERARRREPSALEREHLGEPVKVVVVVDHTGARFLRARSDQNVWQLDAVVQRVCMRQVA